MDLPGINKLIALGEVHLIELSDAHRCRGTTNGQTGIFGHWSRYSYRRYWDKDLGVVGARSRNSESVGERVRSRNRKSQLENS